LASTGTVTWYSPSGPRTTISELLISGGDSSRVVADVEVEALVGRRLRVLWKRARRTWEVVLGGRREVGWRVAIGLDGKGEDRWWRL